jgi:hypothetical protein
VLHSIKNGSDAFSLDFVPEAPHSLRMFLVVVDWFSGKQFFRFRYEEQSFNVGCEAADLVEFGR